MVVRLDKPDKSLLFIRMGSLTEKDILRHMQQSYAGIIVGANMIEAFDSVVTPFLRTLNRSSIIDPMLYLFSLNPKAVQKNGDLKESINSLAKKYGKPLQDFAGLRPMVVNDLVNEPETISKITKNILDFEINVLGREPNFADYYAEFETLLPKSRPAMLLPPYIPVNKYDNEEYYLNLKFAHKTIELKSHEMLVFPVIELPLNVFKDESILKSIASDYSSLGADGYWILASGLSEVSADNSQLSGLRNLVRFLAKDGKPVFKYYGGYFSALLFDDGLNGFSCGIGHGESKQIHAYGGNSNNLNPKFYVPSFHRYIDLSQAQMIFKQYPELKCHCPVCEDTYGKNIENFHLMSEQARDGNHYIISRINEINKLRERGLEETLDDIAGTIQRYEDDILIDVRYLKRWYDTLLSVKTN